MRAVREAGRQQLGQRHGSRRAHTNKQPRGLSYEAERRRRREWREPTAV